MADLGYYDDKLLKDGQPGQDQANQTAQNGVGTSGVVTGGQGSQTLAQQSGVGAGGTGGWTNIQSYLNANKKDTGSAQALESKIGSTLQGEQNKLNSEVDKTVQQANETAKTYDNAKNDTKQWVNQAANAYSWEGQHGQDYGNNVNKIKGLMTQQYQGPQSFSYATSQDYNRGKDALSNDQGFRSYLGDIYRERSKSPMTSGQLALQNQFDTNNENLAKTRTSLLDRMAGFDSTKDEAIKRADSGIQSAQNKFRNDQSSYNDYLMNLQNEYDTQIADLESGARNEYQNTFKTDKSGKDALQWGAQVTDGAIGNVNQISDERYRYLMDRNAYAGDMTFEQLQNEQNLKNSIYGGADGAWTQYAELQPFQQKWDRNRNALSDFYKQQDDKYSMTADAEERNYNTLSEILGLQNKKEKGFKVRG